MHQDQVEILGEKNRLVGQQKSNRGRKTNGILFRVNACSDLTGHMCERPRDNVIGGLGPIPPLLMG